MSRVADPVGTTVRRTRRLQDKVAESQMAQKTIGVQSFLDTRGSGASGAPESVPNRETKSHARGTGLRSPRAWRYLGLTAGWILWAAWSGWHMAGRLSDDAFITLRYADNMARGAGLVFNPGERAFGCTEPLLAMTLGALRWALGLPLPELATAIHALALLTLSALILVSSANRGRAATGIIAGTIVLVLPLSWTLQG